MDDLALLRVLDGDSTPEERAAVDRWLEASEVNRVEFDALKRTWELAATAEDTARHARAVWDRLAEVVAADATDGSALPAAASVARSRPRTLTLMPAARPVWRASGAWAAALTVAVAAAVFFGIRVFGVPTWAAGRDAPTMRVLATARGEHAEIRLPDGSRVVLNASSTLKLPMEFSSLSRDLYLDGEAYFEVKHEPERPFNIHTANGIVEDRGTRFVIVAYSSDSVEHVAVQEGEVAIRSAGSRDLVLRAGEVGSVNGNGTVSHLSRRNPDDFTAWMEGRVDFDNVTLTEAVRVLERQFDIHVNVTDSALAGKRFSASFNGDNVDRSMRALAFLLDARYQRAGPHGTITLAPR